MLSIAACDRGWELVVRDNGIGLGDEDSDADRRGHGLRGMRRRAAEIGAELNMRSAAEQGTTVRLRLELRPRRATRLRHLWSPLHHEDPDRLA